MAVPLILQYLQNRLLDKSIQRCRDTEMTDASSRLWDGHAPDRPGTVIPCLQLSSYLRPFPFQVIGQFCDLHTIYAGTASISNDFPECHFQVVAVQYQVQLLIVSDRFGSYRFSAVYFVFLFEGQPQLFCRPNIDAYAVSLLCLLIRLLAVPFGPSVGESSRGFRARFLSPNMPSADFCHTVRVDCSPLSHL